MALLQENVEEVVRGAVEAHRDDRGALLPILHDIQEKLGYIDATVVPILAKELNLSRADVHGVVTFYHDFRKNPAGATTVRICRAEACQSVGAERLTELVKSRLGVDFGQTTPDGGVTLEQVFCFGNCALGPAVQVGEKLYGRMDADRLAGVLEAGR
ncbi:formate dehydrogenase subunit gamma [Fodinicola acaciae]|uniref:formate dehydrogenase subunit gamma n=1 Tax=Fodinicola acaciae TaxID=2681555 RepID=UPI0013D6898B|nr:formate dehydrogenase subunit gamma [Fodinicola acaciae]